MQYGNRLSVKVVSAIVTVLMLTVVERVHADMRAGTVATVTDNKAAFKASGNLTTTDTAIPAAPWAPARPANNGLDGPRLIVSAPLPPVPPGPNNWEFLIKHKTNAPHWVAAGPAAGAKGVQVCIAGGSHDHGPHPGPPPPAPPAPGKDIDPNVFPWWVCSKAKDLGFGAAASSKSAVYKRRKHPIGGPGSHWDHYMVLAVTSALPRAAGNQITGVYDIAAKHTVKEDTPSEMKKYALGSSTNAGTMVAYDHDSRQLRFSIGAIDVLDSNGGQSGVIDKLYAEDPIVAGKLTVSELAFIEQLDDGRFKFGGGEVAITDPAEKFEFNGSFSEYLIDETVGGPSVTSFALLDSLAINDVAEEAAGASRFLDEFIRVNILGKGIPEAQWLRIQGLDLTFLTATDLVTETNNFTQSAELPATVLIALNELKEDLAKCGMLGIEPFLILIPFYITLRRKKTQRFLE
ncbi:MAG: hypothetical protein GY800_07980 [Planctomycetes bacterium]|nr:hypothetical protein [Planctomycetota bacterium]